MVFGFLKGRKYSAQADLFISLDIGTELLKGILFSRGTGSIVAKSHFYLRQPKKAMRSGKITDKELVTYGVDAVVSKLTESFVRKDTKVMLGIAGDLVNGVSIEVTYTRKNPNRVIDSQEETQILEYVYNEVIKQSLPILARRLGLPEQKIALLHIGVVGILIDGVPTEGLVGQKGGRVLLNIYSSFAPHDDVFIIGEVMQRLGLKPVGLVAQPYAVARAYKSSRRVDFSAIFVDIGGGTTDIAIVLQGFSLKTKMYAFGGRIFTERIAKELGVTYEIAEDIKMKYSAGLLNPSLMVKVREALREDVNLWVETFKNALEEFSDIEYFPEQVYLCGGGAMLPDLQDVLRNYAWTQVLRFNKHPTFALMSPYDTEGVLIQDPDLKYPYDVTPVSLARVYFDIVTSPRYNYVVLWK